MLYMIQEGRLVYEKEENAGMGDGIAIISKTEMLKELHRDDPFDQLIGRVLDHEAVRFETQDQMDVLCLNMTDEKRDIHPMVLFFQAHSLWIITDQKESLDVLMESIMQNNLNTWSMQKIFVRIMEERLKAESAHLDQLQKQLVRLEDGVIKDRFHQGAVTQIMRLRKWLLHKDHLYECSEDALSLMALNENALYTKAELASLALIIRQYHRLAQRVSALQDYVSDLRDAYQAQVGIDLNATMRIFTVITAVFLPLTLIVGWYGMNFDMPEYAYEYAYPIIIGVSTLLTIFLLLYFKRHRWF